MIRFQYQMRTLLVAVFLCALALLPLRVHVQRLREQHDVIRRLEARDSFGLYLKPLSPQWLWRPLVGEAAVTVAGAHLSSEVCAGSGAITPEELAVIKRWRPTAGLRIRSPLIDDSVLMQFCKMRELRSLIVEDSLVTDAGLSRLPLLVKATYLVIRTNREITDEGIARIAQMPRLEQIYISGAHGLPLSNAALRTLSECPALTSIRLDANAVTDDGLHCLGRLPLLYELELNSPLVTSEGVDWLVRCLRLRSLMVNGARVDVESRAGAARSGAGSGN